jgi:hypothetical protein
MWWCPITSAPKLSEFASVTTKELYEKQRIAYDVNLFGTLCLPKTAEPLFNENWSIVEAHLASNLCKVFV